MVFVVNSVRDVPHSPNDFFEYEATEVVVCGECLDKDLADTGRGVLKGDEAVHEGTYRKLSAEWPQQCDNCMKQNAAYEEEEESFS
jgi:hypothetical protein